MWLQQEKIDKRQNAAASNRFAPLRERRLLALLLFCVVFYPGKPASAQAITGISVNSDCDTVGGISASSAVTLQDGSGNVLAWQDSSSGTGLFIPFQNSVNNTQWTANSTSFTPSTYDSQCAPASLTVSAGTFNAAIELGSSTSLPSFTFTLTNTGGSAIYLPATPYFPGGAAFFSLSNVTMIGPYSSVNLTVTINASARSLARGTYTASIDFANAAALGLVTTRQVVLTVVSATHDFNGDGYSDILWRNADGDVAMWLMQNFSLLAAPDIENVATSWSIAGIRDFDGDGHADVLWRNDDGDVAIWLMNGTSIISAPDLENVSTSWAIVGTGDFNGDGKGDILWRNTDGDVAIWLMNGTSITAAPDLGNVATTWSIAGTGDFNGDGYTDILWRNSNGDVAIWLMNGTTILSTLDIGNVATSWSIAGTGDFNSDGRADILWRNTNGDVAIWLMNGFTPVSTADLGNVSTTWSIAATGDFNSDGYADILWRSTSGDVAIWLMNGLTTLSTADFDNVPTAWTIQGAGAD